MEYRDVFRIKNFWWGIVAGFAATVVISILMLIKTWLGVLPGLNPIIGIVNIIDGWVGLDVPMGVGWIGHFFIGTIVWGIAYTLLEPILPGPGWLRGILFGLIAWLAMMIVFMPLAGHGFFAIALGFPVVVATLILHLVYGATLGWVYGRVIGKDEVLLEPREKNIFASILSAAVALGVVIGIAVFTFWGQLVPVAALAINYVKYLGAPAGTISTELSPLAPAAQPMPAAGKWEGDWASYNKTLTSDRFSDLTQINRTNAGKLKVLCTYDTGEYTGFNTGLLLVEGALVFTDQHDIYSIDPLTCKQNWRTHEDYKPSTPQAVNRGAAYMDGMLYRGLGDARVVAYDFKTGKRIWERQISDPTLPVSANRVACNPGPPPAASACRAQFRRFLGSGSRSRSASSGSGR